MHSPNSHKKIIIALDFSSSAEALALVDQLDPSLCRLKVGKELFTAAGPQLVKDLVARDFDVFLDLKFHDIPNTVAKAVSCAAELGVWMVNVHASGGLEMMKKAQQSLQEFGEQRPLLIAVTVLTSMLADDLKGVGIEFEPAVQVKRLAKLAHAAGLDGVVCSAAETQMLRGEFTENFCLVTPGIRRPSDAAGDQKRIVAPAQAIAQGSDYLVVGRPITEAQSPLLALQSFNEEIVGIV
ncbi:MAG: orotidine-5'-phosphate decarboxylase [SAR86 cluster bacterium]|uniref:Orotidine 5'-phosphate decarboxylase n=1 Tax=SAR86 cluster bacterium TaxID=2030880 RepID=A0A2A4MUP5_9GAMM|nr:MAG: orotidine-5'-phosphate decarboxylase [SAR86 cluster bacterium]